MSAGKQVVVIGAGIVGVATAIHLQKQGHRVTLLDRQEPGEGASYGNAGGLNSSSVVPVQVPGLIGKIPGMLRDPDSPLVLRYGYVLRRLPWFLRYLSHSRKSRVEFIAAALAPLIEDCVAQHRELARGTEAEQLLREGPYVFLYESKTAYEADSYSWDLRRRHGVEWDLLSDGEVRNLIPGLADRPWFAVVMRDKHGHVADPGRLVKLLAKQVAAAGGTVMQAEAQGFAFENSTVTGVHTDQGLQAADEVVVATGAWSASLVRPLGLSLPLEAERGYHIELSGAATQWRFPVMWTKGKCVFTPMEQGLRVAGTVEFAGLDAPLNPQRTQLLLRHSRALFPRLHYWETREWLGYRPALPDSLPAIGRMLSYPNVILALGHHHLGLMAGPKTGRLVADLVSGRPSSIDLQPYSPNRF